MTEGMSGTVKVEGYYAERFAKILDVLRKNFTEEERRLFFMQKIKNRHNKNLTDHIIKIDVTQQKEPIVIADLGEGKLLIRHDVQNNIYETFVYTIPAKLSLSSNMGNDPDMVSAIREIVEENSRQEVVHGLRILRRQLSAAKVKEAEIKSVIADLEAKIQKIEHNLEF